MRKYRLIICLILSLVSICFGQMRKKDYRLDSELFRRGLIERGFDDWVKLYDEQHPPMSDLDFLAEQIANAWLKYRRAKNSNIRKQALEKLLSLETDRVESYPEHPLSPIWRIRLAADILNEKYGAFAFINLLDLYLPDNYRKDFLNGLKTITFHLNEAEKVLKTRLDNFKKLDNTELDKINRQGLTELYLTATVQAKSLRAWCLYHSVKLAKTKSSEQINQLYKLDNLLKELNNEITSSRNEGLAIIQASTERMLGNFSQANVMLERANKFISASYKIFIVIEETLLALELNKPIVAELQIKQGYNAAKFYQRETGKYELIMLSLALLEGKAKLEKLSEQAICDRNDRNKAWNRLLSILQNNPQFSGLILNKLIYNDNITNRCPSSSLADIEIYARAKLTIAKGKIPLAKSMLARLLARKTVTPFIKQQAAILLAEIFEKQGMFAKAAKIIEKSITTGNINNNNNNKEINCKLRAEAARLSWLAMQAEPENQMLKNEFVKAARALILGCPESSYANKFKLLIADELCEEGKFNEAMQWIEQIPPSSKFYLQSRAERVLILARQFKNSIIQSGQNTFVRNLANQIESACIDMLTIASAKQSEPNNPSSWKLSDSQIRILGSAILATVNVLTNENIAQADKANYLLNKYKPILTEYERKSGSAVFSQINALLKQNNTDSLIQAISLTQKLITQKHRQDKNNKQRNANIANIIIAVLEAIHKYTLEHYAAPLSNSTPMTQSAIKLAELGKKKLFDNNHEFTPTEYEKFLTIYAIIACDDGKYSRAKELFNQIPKIPNRYKIDAKLAKAKIDFANQNYISAAGKTIEILQRVLPSDVRYWQGLIVNLYSHLKLGSDPIQIVNAIVARNAEHPQMGTKATKAQLTKILQIAQSRIKATQTQQQ